MAFNHPARLLVCFLSFDPLFRISGPLPDILCYYSNYLHHGRFDVLYPFNYHTSRVDFTSFVLLCTKWNESK